MSLERPDHSRSKAILIGTSVYHDPEFPALPAVANSLRGMRELLVDPDLCGWPEERVVVLRDASDARRLVQNLRRFARQTTDVLLVYFAGHGTITRRGQLCLILTDTEADDADITGVEFERVREALLDSPAQTKIVILDCCYSGRAIEALAGPSAVADTTDTRGVYTLTASDHTAHVVALEHQADAATSFTGEFLRLVRTGIAGGPPELTLSEVYLHLRRRLQALGLPAPNQRGTDTADRYVFARNAAPPLASASPGGPDRTAPVPASGDALTTTTAVTTTAGRIFQPLARRTSARHPWLAVGGAIAAAVLAVAYGVAELVSKITSGNSFASSTSDDANTVGSFIWLASILATAVALAGFVPRKEAAGPGQRALFVLGVAECVAVPLAVPLSALSLARDGTTTWAITLILTLCVVSLALIANVGLRVGVWSGEISVCVGLLAVAWMIEFKSQGTLLGLPELFVFGALATTTARNLAASR